MVRCQRPLERTAAAFDRRWSADKQLCTCRWPTGTTRAVHQPAAIAAAQFDSITLDTGTAADRLRSDPGTCTHDHCSLAKTTRLELAHRFEQRRCLLACDLWSGPGAQGNVLGEQPHYDSAIEPGWIGGSCYKLPGHLRPQPGRLCGSLRWQWAGTNIAR